MKKIIILSCSFLLLFMTSCEDNIDRQPNDALVPDTAYTTVADLQMGLNGVYGSYSNLSVIQFNTLFTDESKIGEDNGGQGVQLYNHVLNSTTGEANAIWVGRYYTINLANRILEAAQNIVPSTSEQAEYDNILGQCYAIRALCHLDLLTYYTVNPTNISSEAVPYITTSVAIGSPRNTVEEVRDAILEDLSQAEVLINTTDIFYATQNFIDFLRAKIYFVTGDYLLALPIADDIISNVPIASFSEYEGVFLDSNNDVEVIFKKKMLTTDAPIGGVWYFTGTGGAHMEMSNKMFNTLDPDDIRYNVLFDVATSNPSNNVHMINKYPGNMGVPYMNDQKIMRVSEMYLIKAECQARTEDLEGAAQTIKQLRDNRFVNPTGLDTYANLSAAANAILNERFVELAYEGHRYADIKRLRNATNQGIVRDAADCTVSCSIGVTDHRFVLPIPSAEDINNPNLDQNPDY